MKGQITLDEYLSTIDPFEQEYINNRIKLLQERLKALYQLPRDKVDKSIRINEIELKAFEKLKH